MNIHIHLKTKKKLIIRKYLYYFKEIMFKYNWIQLDFKVNQKKTSTSFFSVLKSPFVFKTAQEHIGYNYYKVFLHIFIINKYLFYIFFKKIFKNLSQDIFNKLLLTSSSFVKQKKIINKLNVNNYYMIKNIKTDYLRTFDLFGEVLLKKKFK
uniref:Ribosomal protein S10 n=1 Tax=Coscinodiscus wailesii TaxID=671091 RepID=A0A7T8JJL1_9STRA|nr:ribosomal protein S10 [Coscinodiscus wailesii]QQP21839.1 ribosomal protein S10 [Coscinodiscus wailesii]